MSDAILNQLPPDVAAAVKKTKAAAVKSPHRLSALEDALGASTALEHVVRGLHRHHGYQLELGLATHLQATVRALNSVASLGMNAAPIVLGLVDLGAGEAMLVTRYAACTRGKLTQAAPPFTSGAKERFMKDARALAGHGFVHPYAFRSGYFGWLYAEETDTLVLDAWGALQALAKEEAEGVLKKIDAALQR